jgi:hypothetical protein
MVPCNPPIPSTAPLPGPSLPSQGTHPLIHASSRGSSGLLRKWVPLRREGTQGRGNLISARGQESAPISTSNAEK